ncbi:MAG TPA: phosphoribosyltransferase family protein [Thermomicrobiales bacterium]|nr:phosphoribosyltransferase family protein [Thermomicrobiales bacterium]
MSDVKDRPAVGQQQATLPLLGHTGDAPRGGVPAFAHPAEQEVARLLTFFGLRWAYEPTTFALKRHPDGRIAEAFSPDFFLPDLNLYLELTTMRQKLVTRKNRKARLLRELFPNVQLRLIYRRDYLRMMECYRGEMRRFDGADISDVVRSEHEIAEEIDRIALRLIARLQRTGGGTGGSVVLLAVSRSSRHFQMQLANRLEAHGVSVTRLDLSIATTEGIGSQPRIRFARTSLQVLRETPVVLVETLVSSGLTLGHAQRWLTARGVGPMETIALFARTNCRIGNAVLDHVSFEAPNDVLAGYGLQLRAAYADLPYVGKVHAGSGSSLDPFFFSTAPE